MFTPLPPPSPPPINCQFLLHFLNLLYFLALIKNELSSSNFFVLCSVLSDRRILDIKKHLVQVTNTASHDFPSFTGVTPLSYNIL